MYGYSFDKICAVSAFFRKGRDKLSKKDRLIRQKERQLLAKKQAEKIEREYKDNFTESKTAKKYLKHKGKAPEPAYYLVIKLLMLIPFGWSAFYWGGVLSIGILGGMINQFEFSELSDKTALFIIAGAVVMAVALIFTFFRKYIAGFAASLLGVMLYIKGANQFIKPISSYISTHAVEEKLLDMDKQWQLRCYPIWAFAVLSGVLLVISVVFEIVKAKKQKKLSDNAPVKSIVDD